MRTNLPYSYFNYYNSFLTLDLFVRAFSLLIEFTVLEGLSLEEDDIPILPRGNLSDRECLQPNSTSKCSCINLWESDCRCDGTDSREKSVCGDCTWYCNEYFSPKNISEFEIDKCNVPKIKKVRDVNISILQATNGGHSYMRNCSSCRNVSSTMAMTYASC
jgi:hypothetical protein